MRYAGEKRFNGWTALTLVLLALFLLFVIYPIGMLLIKSLFTGGKIDLSYFVKFFTKKYYWGALVNSFKVTVVSTLVASLIGVPMAYLLRSVKIRGAGLINILIVISYLSPPFIGAYSWIQLLGRNGFITRIANALFGVKLPGIYGFAGIVLVFSLQSFPLIYMYVSGAMKNLDNSLNEAAESLGCNAFQRVTKIIFPLVMPSLLAGALLVFMRVFADFGTPMIIGEGYKTFPVMLYTQFMGEVGTNDGFAATMCLIVIVIDVLLPAKGARTPVHLFHVGAQAHGSGRSKGLARRRFPHRGVSRGARRGAAPDHGARHVLHRHDQRLALHRRVHVR